MGAAGRSGWDEHVQPGDAPGAGRRTLPAVRSGLAVTAVLLGLVAMHTGLLPTTTNHAGAQDAGGTTHVLHAGWGTAAMPAVPAQHAADGSAATVTARASLVTLSAPEPEPAGHGPFVAHAGGMTCVAVLAALALSLLAITGRPTKRRTTGAPPTEARRRPVEHRPPRAADALALLCVLRQ